MVFGPDLVGSQMRGRSRSATAPGGSRGRWRGCGRRRAFPSTDRAGTSVLSGGGTCLTSGSVAAKLQAFDGMVAGFNALFAG